MEAIDLYSGVGGWSLGLSMAGIKVVKSYEWWKEANLTNFRNNLHESECVDIRTLSPSSLPSVDIVVGSPPCTQFSLANRGGKGDIMEGLKDVEKFLEIVQEIRPKFWAMENVPRLSSIMCREFNQGGVLNRFCHLNPQMMVLDSCEWGVPQKRQRLVVGNLDFDLLLSYRSSIPTRTLGDVMSSLSSDPVLDPVYGTEMPRSSLVDHEEECEFSWEEERINREAKTCHPIYNNMSFPDRLDRPSRTITATSTRVSRESVVVPCAKGFRRLTLREQASIQSFPINYQFYGETHVQKQKMIGNAIPPLLTYHIACSMLGVKASDLSPPRISAFSPPSTPPRKTNPDKQSHSFPAGRKFRFAVPNLRFKSGVRFELTNSFPGHGWGIKFFYGNSKEIREIVLGLDLLEDMRKSECSGPFIVKAAKFIAEAGGIWGRTNSKELQKAWSHSEDQTHPFVFMDSVGMAAKWLSEQVPREVAESVVSGLMLSMGNPGGFKKLVRHAPEVFSGLVVCSLVNEMFSGKPSLLEC